MSSIQGLPLEVTVVGCNKLKDTEWISKQDPYVCLEYATSKFRTRTCTDGHKDPVFQEKFVVPLIEGLRELVVLVWNSNTLTVDDLIGTGRVQLQNVLTHGYDDSVWPIQGKQGRYTGEVRLIMHFQSAKNQSAKNHKSGGFPVHPSPMPATPAAPYTPMYTTPAAPYTTPTAPYHAHLPPHTPAYAPPYPAPYPNPSAVMPPSPYHTPQPSHYPAPAPQTYPPAPYPHTYPPPPASTYPPGPFPGLYPPPPY